MENNHNFPARQFHSLTFFAGLCIGITPVAQALAAEGQTNADDTLVVEASTPSLYAPQQSADPKFSRPVADTTRTMTVISEQVIKDQGATNLTDALKNVPGVGAFFAGENGNSTTGDAIYMRGADTSNSIYIDGIRDIGSVSRDTFNTEQVEVIKGPSGTDYGRSAPTGSINMISKQPRNDSGIDASASIGSAWFRRGTLDVNQVIGDTTAVRLNVMGEKTHDAGRDKVKNEVLNAVNQHALFFAAALPRTLSTPLFNRYQNNETYGFHVDGAVRSHPQNGWMRTDLSATLFLSDPQSYDGGELVVNDTFGQHRVKLPAGDLVLYPSSSLHCVTPVTRGVRVASFMWIQSMIRDDKKRAMLFELDNNIQSLKSRYGESEEILSLLNLYHNLLREWSEI